MLSLVVLLLTPVAATWLRERVALVRTLGPVFMCYGVGLVLANFTGIAVPTWTEGAVLTPAVALAIPLLLFTADVRGWLRLSRQTMIAYALAVVSVLVLVSVARLVFSLNLENAWQVSAMLAAAFVGGTPNMAAISESIAVPPDLYIMTQTSDLVCGGLYFLFLVTAAGPVLGRFLPPFSSTGVEPTPEHGPVRFSWRDLGLGVLCSAGCLGLGLGLGALAPPTLKNPVTIITLTTAAIALSFVPQVHRLEGTHEGGQYLLLVFCTGIGLLSDLTELLGSISTVLPFTAFVMFGTLGLHLVLCRLAGIDRDTCIITSVAAIYGPPFIGPVAEALNNREIEVSGMITASVGLALGNYVGLMVAAALGGL